MDNGKMIIIVTGEMAAGKGEVARYIAQKYMAYNIRSSDVFRRALDVINTEQSRESVSEMSRLLRMGFGEDIAAKAILHDLVENDQTLFVIDGIRRVEEIDAFAASSYKNVCIYLTVDIKKRYERAVERGENVGDTQKSFEDFAKNHELNAESTVEEVKPKANYVIANDGTLEELHEQIDMILKQLDIMYIETM
jgi:dephospho-CoA kinase